MCLAARGVDDGREVFDFASHRVRLGVAAVAASAASVGDDGESLREMLAQRDVLGTVVKSAADQDHNGAIVAESVVANSRAVGRSDVGHARLLAIGRRDVLGGPVSIRRAPAMPGCVWSARPSRLPG